MIKAFRIYQNSLYNAKAAIYLSPNRLKTFELAKFFLRILP